MQHGPASHFFLPKQVSPVSHCHFHITQTLAQTSDRTKESCAREGLNWILGKKNSLWKRLSSTERFDFIILEMFFCPETGNGDSWGLLGAGKNSVFFPFLCFPAGSKRAASLWWVFLTRAGKRESSQEILLSPCHSEPRIFWSCFPPDFILQPPFTHPGLHPQLRNELRLEGLGVNWRKFPGVYSMIIPW